MNNSELFYAVRDGSVDLEEFLLRQKATDDLADAAEKLGKCHSADSKRPEHSKQCARCAVKTAVQKYRETTK